MNLSVYLELMTVRGGRIEKESQNNDGLGILLDDRENEIVGKENVGANINDGMVDEDEEWSPPGVVEEEMTVVVEREEKILLRL